VNRTRKLERGARPDRSAWRTLRERLPWLPSAQFGRFLIVGGINTGATYAVFYVLLRLGAHYAAATAASVAFGFVFNFKTHGVLVFRNPDNRQFIRFMIVYGGLYLFNVAYLRAISGFGLSLAFWQAAFVPVWALCAYLLLRRFVYQRRPAASAEHPPGGAPPPAG
jgi:putative flippase GtrA